MKAKAPSNLTPVPKVDKNGHTVTRWVKILDTGEPGINLPSPQSSALEQFAEDVFAKVFPRSDERSGEIIDVTGGKCYYTPSFVKHALEKLPPKTLRHLADSLSGEEKLHPVEINLVFNVNEYISAMYENVEKDDLQDVYQSTVRNLNNALAFREVVENLSETLSHVMYQDCSFMLNTGLSRYEKFNGTWVKQEPLEWGDPNPSLIDYSELPRRKQKEAMAYVIASHLMSKYDAQRRSPDRDFVRLAYESLDRQPELIRLVQERGTGDIEVLRAMMTAEVTSLSSGML